MRASIVTLTAVLSAIPFETALAAPAQPFDNLEPSLVVNELMLQTGVFPNLGGSGSALGDTLGFVYDFADSFVPDGSFARNRAAEPARHRRCSSRVCPSKG